MSTLAQQLHIPIGWTDDDPPRPVVVSQEWSKFFEAGGLLIANSDELAQHAVGEMIDATLVYVEATPLLTRAALSGAITAAQGSNTTALGTFTKAQLDAAVSDGNVLYVGDITQYTDEQAQDAVGGILTDTATIDFTYNDGANTITADVKANSIGVAFMHASATDVLFGRSSAGAGAGEEVPCTSVGRAVLAAGSAAAAATAVGLGSGISVVIATAKLTGGGANGSQTFTNGVLTAQVAAT